MKPKTWFRIAAAAVQSARVHSERLWEQAADTADSAAERAALQRLAYACDDEYQAALDALDASDIVRSRIYLQAARRLENEGGDSSDALNALDALDALGQPPK